MASRVGKGPTRLLPFRSGRASRRELACPDAVGAHRRRRRSPQKSPRLRVAQAMVGGPAAHSAPAAHSWPRSSLAQEFLRLLAKLAHREVAATVFRSAVASSLLVLKVIPEFKTKPSSHAELERHSVNL